MYSKKIADSIENFMSKRINKECYHFNKEKGVFSYNFIPNCKIKSVYGMVFVKETLFYVISVLDLKIADENVETMLNYLNEINQHITSAKFEFNSDKKEISCKRCVNCKEITLTDEIISRSLRDDLYFIKIFGDFLYDIAKGREIDEKGFRNLLVIKKII
jgi:hypothetical protein